MISIIKNAPANVAAFTASGEVTKEDFENVVMPHVKAVVNLHSELNYVLNLDTDISNFTMGAWLQDALLGIKNITKWNRAAIVTEKQGIQKFTEIFSIIMPGEFKGFDKAALEEAVNWASTGK
ncbi:MAG: STAS/SEC14 domain-containing protein [Sphingobacteriales bacterium]|nr:MAG: STAS/SEC14 domain-containing protein [Sphingobacteriales bacterium]